MPDPPLPRAWVHGEGGGVKSDPPPSPPKNSPVGGDSLRPYMTYKKFFSYSVFPLPGNGREGGMRNFFSFLRRREKSIWVAGEKRRKKREYEVFISWKRIMFSRNKKRKSMVANWVCEKKMWRQDKEHCVFTFCKSAGFFFLKGFPRKRKSNSLLIPLLEVGRKETT